ncbi:TonB-dependent receptor [Aliiglaciecola sp. 2_MG-2023]|uniref:TonB-dependent receptor family protein n=1 Tax=unclassified Aliiglaciecola TaxID=2593648 RepID=UPI0026E47C6D|nr:MULTISPECIES: TonB-dependent receptor [unclassified Aliiglaciecola]MDO6710493.1 TonB-dependent receptor [Aliiglaciecola sp. 2_MG-2023]MDO6751642.1 TonB-dependent receptor [Aliiglaciecola sp. 1_MG-2023]
MTLKLTLISTAILSSLLLASYPTQAVDNIADIEKLTVNGILPSRLEAVAGSFDILGEDYLQARRPISVNEQLRALPGIMVVADGSMSFDLNIGIRGQNPRRSAKAMVMEDGMPLQLAPYTDPVNHYATPSTSVTRVEVVKGAGQILYGPQTLAGAVNFVTKAVPRNGEIQGSFTSRFGNQNFQGLHGSIGYGSDKGGLMFELAQTKGDGIFYNSDYDIKDYRFKGEYNITDKQKIGLKVVHTKDRRNQTENYLTRDEYANDPYDHPTAELDKWQQDRDIVQLTHTFEVNNKLTLSSQAYYSDIFRNGLRGSNSGREVDGVWESRLRNCDAIGDTNGDGNITVSDIANSDINLCGGRHAPRQYFTWGAESRADFAHKLFNLENDVIVGVRFHKEEIHRQQVYATTTAQRLDYQLALVEGDDLEGERFDGYAVSYYAQNTTYIDNWSVTAGFRFEDVTTRDSDDFSTNSVSDDYTKFLPSLSIAWNGINNTTVFAGVHKGISPARADRDLDASGARAVPEESTLYEVGMRSNYAKGVMFSGAIFHNDIENTIVDNGATFDNSGESEQQGIELAGRINFADIYGQTNNVYLSGAYTNLWTAKYIKASDPDNDGNRMQYAPKQLINLDFGYEHASGIDARIGVQYVGEQFVDDENTQEESANGIEGTISSYTIWNATVNYYIPDTQVTLFASIENVFDKTYLVSRNEGKLAGRERLFFGGITFNF